MSDPSQCEHAVSEAEVRRLRDNIYGHHSDQGWDACKAGWMKPENVQWLREHQPAQPALHEEIAL